MQDYYRRTMKKSFRDAMWLREEIEDEYGFGIPKEILGQMALRLYQNRIEQRRMTMMRAMQETTYPDSDPTIGRQ